MIANVKALTRRDRRRSRSRAARRHLHPSHRSGRRHLEAACPTCSGSWCRDGDALMGGINQLQAPPERRQGVHEPSADSRAADPGRRPGGLPSGETSHRQFRAGALHHGEAAPNNPDTPNSVEADGRRRPSPRKQPVSVDWDGVTKVAVERGAALARHGGLRVVSARDALRRRLPALTAVMVVYPVAWCCTGPSKTGPGQPGGFTLAHWRGPRRRRHLSRS